MDELCRDNGGWWLPSLLPSRNIRFYNFQKSLRNSFCWWKWSDGNEGGIQIFGDISTNVFLLKILSTSKLSDFQEIENKIGKF